MSRHLWSKGENPGPEQLACEAAHIEINLLGIPIGKQDHYAAAFGGLNTIRFFPDETIAVQPVNCAQKIARDLFPYLMLVFTGQSRDASVILAEQEKNIEVRLNELLAMREHAIYLDTLVRDKFDIREFHFEDDNMTLQRDRIIAICDEIIARNLPIQWQTPNGIRASVTDEEMIIKI